MIHVLLILLALKPTSQTLVHVSLIYLAQKLTSQMIIHVSLAHLVTEADKPDANSYIISSLGTEAVNQIISLVV